MTKSDQEYFLWRACRWIGMADEDKNKGEPDSDVRRIGRRMAAKRKRAAHLLARAAVRMDESAVQAACDMMERSGTVTFVGGFSS